ncbi:MAG: hypothetical protein WDM89_18940 [Rhizomicrobium sp.]
MITMFRGLGGIADNVTQKDGPFGRGLFPIDPAKRVRLHLPRNLLVPLEDAAFENDRLIIRSAAEMAGPERAFFDNYQEAFSWNAEGRAAAFAYIKSLDDLPSDVRQLLSEKFSVAPLSAEGSLEDRAQRWFLDSRKMKLDGRYFLMPVIELLNHAPHGVPFDVTDGIKVEGAFSGEAFARYSIVDPFGMFQAYGFASPEQMCFSFPMTHDKSAITINRDIDLNLKVGDFYIPEYTIETDRIVISCMMIGSAKFPRLSRGIFRHVLEQAGRSNADEVFDLILHTNRTKLFHLLEILEPHEGGLIPVLRKMVRYQLEAMSHCIGARNL